MGQLLEEAVLDIPEFVAYVREAGVLEGPTLERFLPELEVPDIQVELDRLEAPIYNVAAYRAWDTAPPFGRRQGFSRVRIEIAPLGISFDLTERQITRQRLAGVQSFRQGLRDAGAQAAFESLWDDGAQATVANRLRIERARAELLSTGLITLNENGLRGLVYDPGVPATHIVAAATAWSDTATSLPVTNLQAWETTFRADNSGFNPDLWLTSEEVLGDLVLNAQIRDLAPVAGSVPSIVSEEIVGAVLRAHGVRAPIVTFEGMTADPVTGIAERLLDERLIIGLRIGNLGNTFYGTSASAEMLVGNGRLERRVAPGIVAWVEEEIRPAAIITTAEGVALPALRDPNALFVATV